MKHNKLILVIVLIFALGIGMGVGGIYVLPKTPPLTHTKTLSTPEKPDPMGLEKDKWLLSNYTNKSIDATGSRISLATVPESKTSEYAPKILKNIREGSSNNSSFIGVRAEAASGLVPPVDDSKLINTRTFPRIELSAEAQVEATSNSGNKLRTGDTSDQTRIFPDAQNVPRPVVPLWRINAVTLQEIPEGPQIAVVIDDAGVDRRRTQQIIGLPGPLTIAFLTYAQNLKEQVKSASMAGHEIMTHVPMQPKNPRTNPGKNALETDLEPAEVKSRLAWALNQIPSHVGINNHMGSHYTTNETGMQIVMAELRKRGLLFLDSRTTRETVGAKLAQQYEVPYAVRNIFLDHEPKIETVKKQLNHLEKIARKRGYAVAIGHPRDVTIQALSQWLPVLAEKGIVLVPISAIIARREGIPQNGIKMSVN